MGERKERGVWGMWGEDKQSSDQAWRGVGLVVLVYVILFSPFQARSLIWDCELAGAGLG